MSECDQVGKLREILVREIDLFLKSGRKLVCGIWGDEAKDCACALNAALGRRNLTLQRYEGLIHFYRDEFNFDFTRFDYTISSFIAGFDGEQLVPLPEEEIKSQEMRAAYFLLGQELREKYRPKKWSEV